MGLVGMAFIVKQMWSRGFRGPTSQYLVLSVRLSFPVSYMKVTFTVPFLRPYTNMDNVIVTSFSDKVLISLLHVYSRLYLVILQVVFVYSMSKPS